MTHSGSKRPPALSLSEPKSFTVFTKPVPKSIAHQRFTVTRAVSGFSLVAIARATREEPSITLGASPRATVALMRAARGAAILEGRDFVTPDDVKSRAPAVLRHRVTLAPELEVEGRSIDDVLAIVTGRVAVPD